jgi:hypothetical protein
MKNFLKVIMPVLFLVLLAASATPTPEPTPTEVPPPTHTPLPTPLPTVNPEWPEQANVVAEFFKAWSEKRADDALSYLAEDVRLDLGGICFSEKYARAILGDAIEDPMFKSVMIVENYQIDGDMVHVDFKEYSSSGELTDEGSKSYFVSDGLIQWQAPCQPED